MSFAIKYLDLVTRCHLDLQAIFEKKEDFFGRKSKLTDESASDIIMHSIEEHESILEIQYEDECLEFFSYDVLFKDLKEGETPSEFLCREFFENYALEDSKEFLTDMFANISKTHFNYFVTMYTTALYKSIVDNYRAEYIVLEDEYPGLPYYPSFSFSYAEEDYYESSRC